MSESYLERLSVRQLIAFLFLVEDVRSVDELEKLIREPAFLEQWKNSERRYAELIRYYPNEKEEKHYLIAVADAVYGIDPYSDETQNHIYKLMPSITVLLTH